LPVVSPTGSCSWDAGEIVEDAPTEEFFSTPKTKTPCRLPVEYPGTLIPNTQPFLNAYVRSGARKST